MDVVALADSGVVLRGRIKTQPGAQWGVGRAFNRRIKQAWDAAGIDIPYPHMHLVLPRNGGEGGEPPRAAANG